MEPSSLMELVLLTSGMGSELLLQKTASVLASLMSAARTLTSFLHHLHQLSSTNQSAAEETTTVLELESRDLLSLSLSLGSGLTCVLSSMPSQWSRRLVMLENPRLSICISVVVP